MNASLWRLTALQKLYTELIDDCVRVAAATTALLHEPVEQRRVVLHSSDPIGKHFISENLASATVKL